MSKSITCISELAKKIYNLCDGKGISTQHSNSAIGVYLSSRIVVTEYTSIAASLLAEAGIRTWTATVIDRNTKVKSYSWSENS